MQDLLKRFTPDRRLKILLLEDSDVDAFLIQQYLENLEIPHQIKRVEDGREYSQELQNEAPDIILSDYNLPDIDGLEALDLRKQYFPDVPFIFVTAYLGEERAVETLRTGATDFILKNNLNMLTRLIIHALQEVESARRRVESENALKKSEAKYRQLIEQAADGILICDKHGVFVEVNSRACEMFGYTREEFLSLRVEELVPPAVVSPMRTLNKLEVGQVIGFETSRQRKDKTVFPVEIRVTRTSDGYYQAILRDITRRKIVQHALEEALSRFEFHIANSPLAVLEVDHEMRITRWSGRAEKMFGWKEEEVIGRPLKEINLAHQDDVAKARDVFYQNVASGVEQYVFPVRCCTKNRTTIHCESYISVSFDEQGRFMSFLSLIHDTTVQTLETNARTEWREQERKRVAREIHDGIGQMLVATKYRIASMLDNPNAKEDISKVESLLEKAIEEVRRISLEMAPRSVEELGIEDAIRRLCRQIESTTNIQVSFSYVGHANPAGNKVLSTIYRITQEALNNVIKHAHASKVKVELNQHDKIVELKVEDNGKGFELDSVGLRRTTGLRNIQDRVEMLDGEFKILTDNTGTRLLIRLQF